MAKIIVLVLSGPEDRRKAITGLKFAKMARESGELEDVRLIISAQAVGIFKDPAFKDIIDEVKGALPTMVCRMNAESAGVLGEVESSGLPLAAVGKELVRMAKEGYGVISF